MSSVRKRVLVTGGAGFLGSHLCERLVARGDDVLCVDNYFTGRKARRAARRRVRPRVSWPAGEERRVCAIPAPAAAKLQALLAAASNPRAGFNLSLQ